MNAPIVIEPVDIAQRQNETMHEYLRVLGRHKRSIVALTLLFAMLGALSAALEVPIYRATSTLLIDRESERPVDSQASYGQTSLNYEYYFTQYEILKTRPLAERVVDKVGVDPILASMNRKSKISLERILPWTKSNATAAMTAQAKREAAVQLLLGSVRVDPIRNSQLVRLSYEVADPALAAQLANELSESYVENTLESRMEMITKASEWLGSRMQILKQKADVSSNHLKEFGDREGIVSIGGSDSLPAQNVQMLVTRVAEARAARLALEATYQQVISARQAGKLETVLGLSISETVRDLSSKYSSAKQKVADLSARYGPEYPAMVSARNEERAALSSYRSALDSSAESIVREYNSARSVETQMQVQLNIAQGQMQSTARKSFEMERLERERDADRLVYEKFANQAKETNELAQFKKANARTVENAELPKYAIFPNTKRSILAAAILGFVLSVLLALLLEHLDNTIKSADDVERKLQLPVLGLVPQLKGGSGETKPMRYFLEHPKTAFSEAMRTVRTGVLLSMLDKQHKRVLVTSSVPGEGKTTVSLNLAQAMSQMHKVLLIDADLRRPTVGRVFGDGKPQIGLSQFIAGEAKISDCVHQLEGSNTYIMTAGIIPPNPLELLSSHRFSEALDNLGKVFDYIVIDCAPALAVSDALVLSRMVDGVIYVVRSDATPYQAAQSGLKRMKRVDAPLLGVVLNRVGERSTGYGYGRYSYYADGYQQHYDYYTADKKI
jgi:polysaccharide biosynthesis transport protein